MVLSIENAKNGEKTAKIDNYFVHSAYSPQKEAEKFVLNIQTNINPQTIVLIEPGLSYCYSLLKEKYPNSKIGIIRFSNLFEKYNSDWDFCLNFFDNFINNFELSIKNLLSEDLICSTVFINWVPTQNIFYEQNNLLWQKLKIITENARTILITRQFFEKKWLLNLCNFIKYANLFSLKNINQNNKNIVITASGPSLKNTIPIIKKYRHKIFLICLSSACSVLQKNKLQADLYISTDGGFWAGEHLKPLLNSTRPLLLSTESFCKKQILSKNIIIPGNYNDGISSEIFKELNEQKLYSVLLNRNGTVSGTALDFAKNITTRNVYLLGLDLAGSKSFQHTNPNILEKNSEIKNNKISNTETRQRKSQFNSKSLEIYRDWFSNYSNTNNVFRVIDYPNGKLGTINDIFSSKFEIILSQENEESQTSDLTINKIKINKNELCKKIYNIINKKIFTEKWQQQLFPLDYVSKNNTTSDNQKELLENKIKQNTEKLLKKIRTILNDN